MVDYLGAAVGTAFSELFALVKHLVKTVAAFRGQLRQIQTTLGHIEPIIKIIDKYNDRLNRGPEDMAPIKELLEEGKTLVGKCAKIRARNPVAMCAHSQNLTDFNTAVLEKFQLYMLLLNARDQKEILVDVKEIGGDVKEVKELLTTVLWRSGALQSGPEALSDPAVPAAAPDEVEESSRKLNEVGMSEVASEGDVVLESSMANSQEFDFGSIRAATEQFEFSALGAPNNSAKKFQTSIGHSLFGMLRKMKWKKKQRKRSVDGEIEHETIMADLQQFDFGTIRTATDNFSDSRKIGEGGFGPVYKGRLSNGIEIAVKQLSQNSLQGVAQFKSEVRLLARLRHKNLVRLLGFCLKGGELLIIYEFMPNSSLDRFIFDPLKRVNLDWDRRHKIIMGVAQGLLYLHENCGFRIIHRDLKASNILLDLEMKPKISDFGTARVLYSDQTQEETQLLMGTLGYMAPEYAMHGNFSVKSDVFSFGVLLLEIVSGQKNNHFLVDDAPEALTSYVWKKWREGSISNIIDPSITSGSSIEIARCIHIGLLCVQENSASRPTMASVFLMLNSHSVMRQVPSQPAFFMHNAIESDMSSTNSSRLSDVERSRGKSNQFSIDDASMTQYYNSRVSRSRGKSIQFSKNDAPIMQDYSLRECDVERSRGKSNQFSQKKASMTEPLGSFRKLETSVPCALLFMFLMVFGSSILQKKLSFCV